MIMAIRVYIYLMIVKTLGFMLDIANIYSYEFVTSRNDLLSSTKSVKPAFMIMAIHTCVHLFSSGLC